MLVCKEISNVLETKKVYTHMETNDADNEVKYTELGTTDSHAH